jgi:hypothetical protein
VPVRRRFKTEALLNVGGDEGQIAVPGIVFMRGGAVGILVILECEGKEYTILTYQARVPVGSSNVPEVPAGMLDTEGNFKGVAGALRTQRHATPAPLPPLPPLDLLLACR